MIDVGLDSRSKYGPAARASPPLSAFQVDDLVLAEAQRAMLSAEKLDHRRRSLVATNVRQIGLVLVWLDNVIWERQDKLSEFDLEKSLCLNCR